MTHPYRGMSGTDDYDRVTVLFAFEMGQLRHALVQDTWLPEVGVGWRPHRVPV
jgi:hypothetical protein